MTKLPSPTSNMSATKRALLALKQSQEKLAGWERTKYEPIAVIGIGCRFPGGIENTSDFRQLLAEGRDAIGPVPFDRWDMETYYHPEPGTPGKMYSREGGFLAALDRFDPRFFNISPIEAKSMDPQQRLLLEVAWEAFEHAGQVPDRLSGSQTGVFVGMSNFDFATQMSKLLTADEIGTYFGTGSALSVAAGRLSYVFGLTGPSMVVDTACSSSLVSTDLACRSLRTGECNLALAAGVNLIFSPETSVNFSKTGMLSIDSRCKTFDASANGYVRSEGCGVILLKRLSDALTDGDRILAQIVGSAVNQDGPSGGLTVPNGLSQEKVIRSALVNARLDPSSIDYIEAHGTGTSLGDPIEIEALGRIFGPNRPDNLPLMVGSVKTNIGHGEGAAGIAGIIKVILAMDLQKLPPHLHLNEPNPHIPWKQLPIQVPINSTPWKRGQRPRLAGISSFGFSGTNAHVILQEPPLPDVVSNKWERPLHLLALSAKSQEALQELTHRYVSHLEQNPDVNLANLCFTANTGRNHFRHRLVCFASSVLEMGQKLSVSTEDMSSTSVLRGELKRMEPIPKPVFLFTGQGSQYAGMGRELFESQATFRKTLLRCAELVDVYLEKPLLEVLFADDKDPLINETAYAQPAIFALEYALAQMFMAWGIRPAAVLGHSVGEWTAACVAGVFSLEDSLRLIAKRGQALQALPKLGGMQAIFATESEIQPLLKPLTNKVAIAAINGPRHLVVSGDSQTLAELTAKLANQGIQCRNLSVSHAFHSPLVEPAMKTFAKCLEGVSLSKPVIPMLANLHGDFAGEEITNKDYWIQHLRQPVQFAKSMRNLQQKGFRLFVELGPKPILRPMAQRVLAGEDLVWLDTCRQKGHTWPNLLQTMAHLYCLGVVSDWRNFENEYSRNLITVPNYPFQRESYWPEAALAARDRHKQLPQHDMGGDVELETLTPTPKEPQASPSPHQLAQIQALVGGLLQLPPNDVDVHMPFLELGADSLILLDVVRKIEANYGVEITVRQLFEELPCVHAMAEYVFGKLSPSFDVAATPTTKPLEATIESTQNETQHQRNLHRNHLQEQLREMVGRLLQMDAAEVDAHTPFLELGADSLILIDAVRLIEKNYGVKLAIRQLFEEFPTMAALADHIAEQTSPAQKKLLPQQPVQTATAPVTVKQYTSAPKTTNQPNDTHLEAPQPTVAEPLALTPSKMVKNVTQEGTLERMMTRQLEAMSQLMANQLATLGSGQVDSANAVALPSVSETASVMVESVPQRSIKSATPSAVKDTETRSPFSNNVDRKGRQLTNAQQAHMNDLVHRYTQRTRGSREFAVKTHGVWADMRSSFLFRPESKEIAYPIIGAQSAGPYFWDVDGNCYVDVAMGFGVNFFGHNPEFIRQALSERLTQGVQVGPESHLAGDVASLIHELTGVERVTFCNSGTEAVMTAIRIARAATGKSKIVIFSGSYHGHSDYTLVVSKKAGTQYQSLPMTLGVPQSAVDDVLVLPYDQPESLDIIRQHLPELAAVVVEPIQSRQPQIQPKAFLTELRHITEAAGVSLVFDEVLVGFRIHPGGAQHWCGVRADLVTYGKVIGGGMPLGVVSGKARWMDLVDGGVWHFGDRSQPHTARTFVAGTFSKHPLAMTAARAVLRRMKQEGPALQETLNAKTERLAETVNAFAQTHGFPIRVAHFGSLFRITLTGNSTYLFQPLEIDLFFYHLIDRGVYTWEGRTCYLSTAHSDADISHIVWAIQDSLMSLRAGGFWPAKKTPATEAITPPINPFPAKKLPALDSQTFQPASFDHHQTAISKETGEKSSTFTPDSYRSKPPMAWDRHAMLNQAKQSRGVQFSLFFFGNYVSEFVADKYNLLFDATRYADQQGFTAAWFPERHFHEFGGYSPNPSLIAAALAKSTNHIQLRAGSVVLPIHHHVRVVEEWSVVDNISKGRVGVSFASGWHPNDFIFAPENYGHHREKMFDSIEDVRRTWRGSPVRCLNGVGEQAELNIFPMPMQSELPIWLTIVHNPDMYIKAGELGAGILTNLMGQTVKDLRKNIALYRESLAKNGFDPAAGHVTVLLHTFITEDADQAREIAREPFCNYLRSSLGLFKGLLKAQENDVDLDRVSPEDLDYIVQAAYNRYVKTTALIGSVTTCTPIMEALLDAGMDEAACFIDFGIDPTLVMKHLPQLDTLRRSFHTTTSPPDPNPGSSSRPTPQIAIHSTTPELTTSTVPEQVALNAAQRQLLLLAEMDKHGSVAHNESMLLEMAGPLNKQVLEHAYQAMVARHETLRTSIDTNSGNMLIHREAPAHLECLNLSHLTGSDQDAAIQAHLHRLTSKPFDFKKPPLVRIALLELGGNSWRLLLTFHNLVLEGWSVGILFTEMNKVYRALLAGKPHGLEPATPFRALLQAQQAYSESEARERDEAFWLNLFQGEIPMLQMPTDRPRSARVIHRGARLSRCLAPEIKTALVTLGRAHKTTLFMTLQACFMALLHRISGQKKLVTAYSYSGRAFQGCEQALGHGTHYVPVISELTDGMSFSDFLNTTRRNLLTTYEHQRYPFAWLVDALKKPGQTGALPLAQVLFNLERTGLSPEFGDLDNQLGTPPIHFVHFDLFLNFTLVADKIFLDLDYSCDLFNQGTVIGWLEQYESMIAQACANPNIVLTDISLLSKEQHRCLLEAGQGSPLPQSLLDFPSAFANQVKKSGKAVAIESPAGTLTYHELDQKSGLLAHRLRLRGARAERIVPVFVPRDCDLAIALVGILKTGSAFVVLDPQWPNARLAELLQQIQAEQVVVASAFLSRWQNLAETMPLAIKPCCLELNREETCSDVDINTPFPLIKFQPNQLAYLIFTSGSTGTPKGVMLNMGGLMNHLNLMIDALSMIEDDCLAQTAEPSFDIFVWQLLTPLLIGARVCMIDKETVQEPDHLLTTLKEQRVTLFQTVPTLLESLLASSNKKLKPIDLGSLRIVLPTGEALPPMLVNRWLKHISIPLINAYGPAECSDDVTLHRLDQPLPAETLTTPIGHAVPGLNTRVLNPRLGLQPAGLRGELFVSGLGLGRGYWKDPAKTAAAFLPDPFANAPGKRMYQTGDMVWMDQDGLLHYVGRRDHQVKLRGMRIELSEIIRTLEQHDQVSKAIVNPGIYHEEKALIGYVVPKNADTFDAGELRHFIRQRLPEFMVPTAIVPMQAFPTSPNGKIDRNALPDPTLVTQSRESHDTEIMTSTQQTMHAIWCEVLKREKIGLHDHFFDIGGHSLLASKIMSRVRSKFQTKLPLRAFFDAPTISALCDRLPQTEKPEPQVDVKAPPQLGAAVALESPPEVARFPVIEAQRQLILQAALAGKRAASYVEALSLELIGPLEHSALKQAIETIVARHQTTRAAFDIHRFEMLVYPPPVDILTTIDLRNQDPGAFQTWMAKMLEEPLDLAEAPLCHFYLLQLQPEEHVLVVIYHLGVFDGWSIGLLIKELQTLYPALLTGKPVDLAVNHQFNNFRQCLERYLNSEAAQADRDYWRTRFATPIPELDLPRDRPYPATMPHKGGRLNHRLSLKTWHSFCQFARKNKLTPFMAGLSLYGIFLHRLTSQTDLVVGTMTAGRGFDGNDSIMGYCSHFLPIRMDFRGDPIVADTFASIRQTLLEAYQHQNYPFANLIRDLGLGGSVDRFPMFMASFNLEPAPESLIMGELKGQILSNAFPYANNAIHLNLTPQTDWVSLNLDYSADLIDAATADRWLAILLHLFETISSFPTTQLSKLALQPQAEAIQFINRAYEKQIPFRDDVCFPRLFEQVSQDHGEAIAAIEGSRKITYADLNDAADRIAAVLVEEGVGPECVVPLLADRGIDFLTMILSILKAGGAWLPLDPSHPGQRLSRIMDKAGSTFLLTSKRYAKAVPSVSHRKTLVIEQLVTCSQKRQHLRLPICPDVDPKQLAYVIFTSGSTGEPKGAMLNHRGMINHITGKVHDMEMTCADVVAQTASQCFDISVWQFLAPLTLGGTVEILPDPDARDAQALADLITGGRITIFETVPLLLRSLCEVLTSRGIPSLSLRWMMATGEALPPDFCRTWLNLYPHIPIMNAYGPTECSDDITHHVIDHTSCLDGHAVPIGKPLCNTQLFVRDSHGNLLPDQIPGELFAGGAGVGRGYLDNPRQTAQTFLPNPFGNKQGDRLYKTGDRVRRLANNVLDFLGRLDHQVKVRGYRIELGEIEAVLLQAPSIVKAAALVQEHATRGKSIAAFCVHDEGVPKDEKAVERHLQDYVGKHMPAYMVPDRIAFLPDFPANDAGKLNRSALPFLEPRCESFVLATNDTQRLLAKIWAETLEVDTLGITQSFFAMGGNSLIAMRVLSRVQDQFGIRLSLNSIFEKPTIEAFSTLLSPQAGNDSKEKTPLPNKAVILKRKPLSLSGHPALVSAGLIRFEGVLRSRQLQQALDAVVARQPALRMVANHDGFLYESKDPVTPKLEHLDLSKHATSRRDKALAKAAASQARRSFEPNKPLLHLLLVTLGKKNHQLIFHFHNGIADGWSAHVFVEEMAYQLGRQTSKNQPGAAILAESNTAIESAFTPELHVTPAIAAYWRKQLSLPATKSPLPEDGIAKPKTDHSFFNSALTDDCYETLKNLTALRGCTTNTIYLAALFVSLAEISGHTDIMVNTIFSGRQEEAAEKIIAPLAKKLPLRLNLATVRDLPSLLKTVTQEMIEAYRHQHVDLELLMRQRPSIADEGLKIALNEILFIMHRTPVPPFAASQLTIHDLDLDTQVLGERLVLHVTDQGSNQAPTIRWEFGKEDLPPSWVENLSQTYVATMNAFATNPDMILSFSDISFTEPTSIPKLQARTLSGPIPVSHAQERLWLLAQFTERSADFNIPIAIHLQGEIQVDALASGLEKVVARHDILRTVFVEIDGEPRQQVLPSMSITLEHRILSSKTGTSLDSAMHQIRRTGRLPYDIENGPLLRAELLTLGPSDHVLSVHAHHLICDGWSISILAREWAAFYSEQVNGTPRTWEPLALQYTDFAVWERAYNAAVLTPALTAWWDQQLANLPTGPMLPYDKPADEVRDYAASSCSFSLPPELSRDLNTFCKDHQFSPFMVLLAAFKWLLAQKSGQSDIVVGTAVAQRSHVALEPLIGYFVNNLVLRSNVADIQNSMELLELVRRTCLQAMDHRVMPFEKLVARHAHRQNEKNPLFQIMFLVQNAIDQDVGFQGLLAEPLDIPVDASSMDLTLEFMQRNESYCAVMEYQSSLFHEETMQELAREFPLMIQTLITHPHHPLQNDGKQEIEELHLQKAPLTPAQERLWSVQMLQPQLIAYHISEGLVVEGDLNTDLLARCLDTLICRHQGLRTGFGLEQGEPVQRVYPAFRVALPLTDLGHLNEEDRTQTLRASFNDMRNQPFNLEKPPLFRFALFRLDDRKHILMGVMHHIIADEMAFEVLVSDLTAIYVSLRRGGVSPLKPLRLQTTDIAISLKQWVHSADYHNAQEFWTKQLRDLVPVRLPADFPTSNQTGAEAGLVTLDLDSELSNAIRNMSRQVRTTPFIPLLAGLKALLRLRCGREDIAVGTSSSNRPDPEHEALIAFMANTLILRTDLSGNLDFNALIQRVRETVMTAFEHERLPFQEMVALAGKGSDKDLFRIMFTFQKGNRNGVTLDGLKLSPLDWEHDRAKFDLFFLVVDHCDTFEVRLNYRKNLFIDSSMQEFCNAYKRILQRMTGDPTRRIDTKLDALQRSGSDMGNALESLWNLCLPHGVAEDKTKHFLKQGGDLKAASKLSGNIFGLLGINVPPSFWLQHPLLQDQISWLRTQIDHGWCPQPDPAATAPQAASDEIEVLQQTWLDHWHTSLSKPVLLSHIWILSGLKHSQDLLRVLEDWFTRHPLLGERGEPETMLSPIEEIEYPNVITLGEPEQTSAWLGSLMSRAKTKKRPLSLFWASNEHGDHLLVLIRDGNHLDERSMNLLMEDFLENWEGDNRSKQVGELFKWSDFLAWLAALQHQDSVKEAPFWPSYLEGAQAIGLALAGATEGSATMHDCALPQGLLQQLQNRYEVEALIVVQSAIAAILGTSSDKVGVIIGRRIDIVNHPVFESMIGPMEITLPIATQFKPESRLSELPGLVSKTLDIAVAHRMMHTHIPTAFSPKLVLTDAAKPILATGCPTLKNLTVPRLPIAGQLEIQWVKGAEEDLLRFFFDSGCIDAAVVIRFARKLVTTLSQMLENEALTCTELAEKLHENDRQAEKDKLADLRNKSREFFRKPKKIGITPLTD